MSPIEVLVFSLWRLMRVFTVDLVGPLVFWPTLVVVVALLAFLLQRAKPDLKGRLWVLPLLPACWLAAGLAGIAYASDPNASIRGGNSAVENALVFGFVGFLLLWVSVTYYLRGAKLFAALYAVTNLYFMAGMSISAYMAVSGLWT